MKDQLVIYIFSIKGLKLFIGSKDVKFVPTKDSEAFFFTFKG